MKKKKENAELKTEESNEPNTLMASDESAAEIPAAEETIPTESSMNDSTENAEEIQEASTGTEPLSENPDAAETEIEQPTASAKETTEAEEKPVAEKDNAAYMSSQLDKLIELKNENNFTDFWFYVKELNKMIFTLKGITKEDRHKFKDRIGELCDETKKLQDEIKVRVAKTSHLKLQRLQQIIDEALAFGNSHDELEKSFHKIEEANKFLKDGSVKGEDGEESADMSREHREKAKEAIKVARDKIFDRKREIREGNFKRVTEKLTVISNSLMSQGKSQKVFDGIKNLRAEMRTMVLDRTQLREIDSVI